MTSAIYVVGLRLLFAHQMDEMLTYVPVIDLAQRFFRLARVS
jgi:hypothetical protein